MCGDTLLLAVTDEDAKAEGETRAALAGQFAGRMNEALKASTLAGRAKALAWAAGQTLVATLGALLLLWLLGRLFRRVYARIEAHPAIRGFKIQNLEILSADQARKVTRGIARASRVGLTLVLFYGYLSVVFSFFPWTRGLASRLLTLVWSPLSVLGRAFLGYLPNLIFLVLIILATRWLLKLVGLIFRGIAGGALTVQGFHPDWAMPTYKLARLLVFAFALVVCFPYLPGSQSEAFKGVGLFVGLLFSLGSSGAVANMIGGVMITYMRPFKLGDVIQIGDTRGIVVEKSLLVTRLRTPKQVDVTLPNAMVLGSQIQNFSTNAKEPGLLLHTSVTIGYDAPWRRIHALLLEAAAGVEGVRSEPAPFVLQTALDDFYVEYQLNAATDRPEDMPEIYSRLHQAIQDAFFAAGVEIMSPHYAALRDGNTVAIPEGQRPKGYRVPGFRVEKEQTDG
jgi:small-conductance mechanosensitive channel